MPRTTIASGLPKAAAPFEWATQARGIVFTAQVPIKADGSFETGAIDDQCRLTFQNLTSTLKAAGGGLADLTQVLVYLTSAAHLPAFNRLYSEFFLEPYPNRATFVVSALAVPGIGIELVAYAAIDT